MKKSKLLIAVFAVIAAASAAKAEEIKIGFDGKTGAPLFAQLAAQTIPGIAAASGREMEVVIPSRATPVFTGKELEAMDKSIGTAITYVQAHGQGAYLAESFECLLRKGTPEQKFAFVSQAPGTAYAFTGACAKQTNKGTLEDACRWVVEPVCRTVTAVSCAWVVGSGNPPMSKEECKEESKEVCERVTNWICS